MKGAAALLTIILAKTVLALRVEGRLGTACGAGKKLSVNRELCSSQSGSALATWKGR